jgi:tRNA(fMet)-specific endonuclease VapC
MKYMLDTDICSYFLKGNQGLVAKFAANKGEYCISSIVYQELLTGLLVQKGKKHEEAFAMFLRFVKVIPFTKADALTAAELRYAMFKKGHNIGVPDLQIAAHAMNGGLTLVTNNLKHFKPILGSDCETWLS